jgi:hypothetical protein
MNDIDNSNNNSLSYKDEFNEKENIIDKISINTIDNPEDKYNQKEINRFINGNDNENNDKYNPNSYWLNNLYELNKIKDMKINLPNTISNSNLPKFILNNLPHTNTVNKVSNFLSFKDDYKNEKIKNGFNFTNFKCLELNENNFNNENEEDLQIFLTTKPNSDDIIDKGNYDL